MAWGKAEDLRLVWDLNGMGVFTQEMPLTEGGKVKVPSFFPLLWSQQIFWIRKKGGRTLFSGRVYWERGRDGVLHPQWDPKEKKPAGLRFVCPKPKHLSLSVKSKDSGKPLAGAEISFRFPYCPRMWVGGKTDSQGEAAFEVPEFEGESALVVLVRREGFQGGIAYLDQEITYLGRSSREPGPKGLETHLSFSLGRDRPLDGEVLELELKAFSHFISGRVVNEDGDPMSGVHIALADLEIGTLGAREKAIQEMNGDLLQGISDKKGRFRLPLVPFGKPSIFSLRFSKGRKGFFVRLKKAEADLEVVFPSR